MTAHDNCHRLPKHPARWATDGNPTDPWFGQMPDETMNTSVTGGFRLRGMSERVILASPSIMPGTRCPLRPVNDRTSMAAHYDGIGQSATFES
jgi:hypothetical protein